MSVLATQEALDRTALEHAHRVIMAPTKQNLGLLHALPARPASFRRCWVLRRMCAPAIPVPQDQTVLEVVNRVLLALTRRCPARLCAQGVRKANSPLY